DHTAGAARAVLGRGRGRAMIVALAGGVGAARFLEGLVRTVSPESVTVVVNTGDDAEFYGLHVSPDIDIVVYTLVGIVNADNGWASGAIPSTPSRCSVGSVGRPGFSWVIGI